MNLFHRFTFENSLDDPEVEKAASRIQAGFKGHKARKEVKELKEARENEGNGPSTQPSAKIDDQDSVIENTKEEIVDIDLKDPEVEKAATKIQAGFKGHKTRKELKQKGDDEKPDVEKPVDSESSTVNEEIVDIDLEDPEVAEEVLFPSIFLFISWRTRIVAGVNFL